MSNAQSHTGTGAAVGRFRRLALKELRETLRDRRTVVTLLLMPLLVYPLLSVIIRSFLLTGAVQAPSDRPIEYRIVFDHPGASADQFTAWFSEILEDVRRLEQAEAPLLRGHLRREKPRMARFTENQFQTVPEVREAIREGIADVGATVRIRAAGAGRSQPIEVEFVANDASAYSLDGLKYLRDYFDAVNQARLDRWGRWDAHHLRISEQVETLTDQPAKQSISFGTLIPLILVLMTITGAVYPAIDLTAGERERGTLEALIAAPIPRMRILVAKFVAVLTVALLTATLNLIGMLVTVWAFKLEQLVFQSDRPSIVAIAQVFGLLLLYAAFFSSLLLAVTSLARSFKEAQAYLIPLILLALAPSVVSLLPGLNISGWLAVVPMINFVLLARDIFQGTVALGPCLIVITSTLLYSAAALMLASRVFGTDAILYGSHESFKDTLRRPTQVQATASPFLATLSLAFIFAAQFVALTLLARMSDAELPLLLLLMGGLTVAYYALLPAVFAIHQRIAWGSGFGLRAFAPLAGVAAVLIGLAMWPATMGIVYFSHTVLNWFGQSEAAQALQERLVAGGAKYVQRLQTVPFVWVWVTHALIPAVCEEFYFRGFFMQAMLRRARSPRNVILATGIVFGLFHVLAESSLDRLLPATLMGILLSYVCWRTGSVIPGMILHVLHNGIVIGLAYYHQEIGKLSWLGASESQLPLGLLLGVSAVGLLGIGLLHFVPRRDAGDFGAGP